MHEIERVDRSYVDPREFAQAVLYNRLLYFLNNMALNCKRNTGHVHDE